MIVELEQNKAAAERGEDESLGYLGSRSTVHLTGTTMIQWWRSTDDIYAYAAAPTTSTGRRGCEFYRGARSAPRAVTIWHETYAVEPGGAESVYAGPSARSALGAPSPAIGARSGARGRVGPRAAWRTAAQAVAVE